MGVTFRGSAGVTLYPMMGLCNSNQFCLYYSGVLVRQYTLTNLLTRSYVQFVISAITLSYRCWCCNLECMLYCQSTLHQVALNFTPSCQLTGFYATHDSAHENMFKRISAHTQWRIMVSHLLVKSNFLYVKIKAVTEFETMNARWTCTFWI